MASQIDQTTADRLEDIAKSLFFLTRSGGAWKSDKQARFILSFVEGLPEPYNVAPATALDKAKKIACSKVLVLSRATSFRGYQYMQHFIIDEGGVLVMGTHDHYAPGTTPKEKKNQYLAPAKRQPAVSFFPKTPVKLGPQSQEIIRQLKLISNPTPMVLSFIRTLERGQPLSVKQMTAVQSILLQERFGGYEQLTSSAELKAQAKALGVDLSGLVFTKSTDKRKAMLLIEEAKKRPKATKATKRTKTTKRTKKASEVLGGTDGCYMSKQNVVASHQYLIDIYRHLKANPCIEDWAESKLAHAHGILQAIAEHLKYGGH